MQDPTIIEAARRLHVSVRHDCRSAISLAFCLLALFGCVTLRAAETDAKTSVSIVADKILSRTGRIAADELSAYLRKLYPAYSFPVTPAATSGRTIVLSVNPADKELPENPEGYVVNSDGNQAVIRSKSEAGLIHGVYGLLGHLGVGFYLTEEILPSPASAFSFKGWQLRNEPLVKDRYVFNWHNFLSGCTGWDEAQWLEWVERSRRMGYNAIMVHAYFNNPMHTYTFNGVAKRNGYIATSAIGRDWGCIPMNDVRRLPGGDIFDGPVIGSKAAMVPEGRSVDSIQSMMKRVFTHAADRGMGICFAFDADMTLSFVQEDFIRQMPPAGKFMVEQGKAGFPNPDTAEGQAYYTAQIRGLLDAYPMLTQIGCWVRNVSWFAQVKPEELPADWLREWDQVIATHEELKAFKPDELMKNFLVAKIVGAYERALKELSRPDIEVVTGSWDAAWVVPAAVFLPHTKLMPIDYSVLFNKSLFDQPKTLDDFEKYAKGRVIPFVWTHHDDGQYIGRCYKPTDKLAGKLKQAGAAGVGVFHWLNRPQDLYFKNVERQLWAGSANEDCRITCDKMALDYFGDPTLGAYLFAWVSSAPIFGRATQPNFHYRPWKECQFTAKQRADGEERLASLKRVDRRGMSLEQSGRLDYFLTLEQFILEFIAAQHQLDQAEQHIKEGNLALAREALAQGDPERVVRTYAKLSGTGHKDRGEMTYVVTLAGKWIGDYDSFRQRARALPIKIKLGNTFPEPLAQGNGGLCYYIDAGGKFWEKFGAEVLQKPKTPVRAKPEAAFVMRPPTGRETPAEEVYVEGLRLGAARVPIRPIMRAEGVTNASHVTKGRYRLTLYASSTRGGMFDLLIQGVKKEFTVKGDALLTVEVDLPENADLAADCTLTSGEVVLSGLILEPTDP